MPMRRTPASRSTLALASSTVRARIRPIVCKATRINSFTTLELVFVANHAWRSSNARVKPLSHLAHGKRAITTPCCGHRTR